MRDVYGIGTCTTAFGKHPGMSSGDLARIEYRQPPGLRIAGRAPTLEHVAIDRVFRNSGDDVAPVVGDA